MSDTDVKPLHEDMDARRWAKEFCEQFSIANAHDGDQEGTMLAWFANAIMAGFDEANRRHAARKPAYLSQEWLHRYAQEAAFALNGPSYTPKTLSEARNFWPHQWVCEAIQSAWLDGHRAKPKARLSQLGPEPDPIPSQET